MPDKPKYGDKIPFLLETVLLIEARDAILALPKSDEALQKKIAFELAIQKNRDYLADSPLCLAYLDSLEHNKQAQSELSKVVSTLTQQRQENLSQKELVLEMYPIGGLSGQAAPHAVVLSSNQDSLTNKALSSLESVLAWADKFNIHLLVQAVLGFVGIVKGIITTLYAVTFEAKKRVLLDDLNRREKGFLFLLNLSKFCILVASTSLLILSLTSILTSALFLSLVLSVGLIQEWGLLRSKQQALRKVSQLTLMLEQKEGSFLEENTPTGIQAYFQAQSEALLSLYQSHKLVYLCGEQLKMAKTAVFRTSLSTVASLAMALSFLFPPLFPLGLSLFILPILSDWAVYADKRWNQGRIRDAIENNAFVQAWLKSALYRKLFSVKTAENRWITPFFKKLEKGLEPLSTVMPADTKGQSLTLQYQQDKIKPEPSVSGAKTVDTKADFLKIKKDPPKFHP